MKKLYPLTLMFLLLTFLSGCKAIKGIFEAGFWVGIIAVFLVVGVIVYVITRFRG